MRLLVILLLSVTLSLASCARLSAAKRRRESKWDIIHHEYHGPPAPLSKDGRVVDTPEVAEARANHLLIHAETAADLAKKMAEANALEAKEKAAGQESAKAVLDSVQMTPELMAMLMAAVAEEQQKAQQEQQQQQQQQQGEQAAAEPAAENNQEAAPENQQQGEAEARQGEEAKPISEPESNNEIGGGEPVTTLQKNYEGPLAPLGKDGRVLDTAEVKMAKDLHLLAYQELAKLSKGEDEPQENSNDDGGWVPTWKEANRRLYLPPVHLLWPANGPIGYNGPAAPIGENGRVVDTIEVERAKAEHRKAHEHAEAIAKRHPPKAEDNSL